MFCIEEEKFQESHLVGGNQGCSVRWDKCSKTCYRASSCPSNPSLEVGGEDREVERVDVTLNPLQKGGEGGSTAIFCLPRNQQGLEETQVKAELERHVLVDSLAGQGGVVGQKEVQEVGVSGRQYGWREGGGVGPVQSGGEGEEGRVEGQGGGGRDQGDTGHLSSGVDRFESGSTKMGSHLSNIEGKLLDITCCPESPVSSIVTLSQAGSTVRGAPEVTCASEEAKADICSPTQVEKLFFASVSSSLLISDN